MNSLFKLLKFALAFKVILLLAVPTLLGVGWSLQWLHAGGEATRTQIEQDMPEAVRAAHEDTLLRDAILELADDEAKMSEAGGELERLREQSAEAASERRDHTAALERLQERLTTGETMFQIVGRTYSRDDLTSDADRRIARIAVLGHQIEQLEGAVRTTGDTIAAAGQRVDERRAQIAEARARIYNARLIEKIAGITDGVTARLGITGTRNEALQEAVAAREQAAGRAEARARETGDTGADALFIPMQPTTDVVDRIAEALDGTN